MMTVLSEPSAMAETLLANLPVGLLIYEGDTGKCVLANQAAADMLGGSIETLRQQNFQAFASRCRLAETALHLSTPGHHEVTLQTVCAKTITIDCYYSRFEFEGKPCLLCALSDITQNKQTQKKLERERALLRCLIDSASDLIFIKDQNSVYRACNKASEAFIGLPESEQIGKTDDDFFDREKAAEIREADRQVIDEGRPVHYEEWVTDRHGRHLLMDTVKTPYFDPDGKPLGLVGIGRDATERKLLEQERLAHLRFFESMDRVNRAIQANNDLEQMMSEVLDVVLSVFHCDRAFLLYPCDPQARTCKVPMEKTRPEYPGALALDGGVPIDPQVAETFRILLSSDGPVKFGPGAEFPLPKDIAEQFGFKSKLSMALHPRIGKSWEFGLHQCTDARVWTREEERIFQEIGRRLEDALSTLLAHRDLRRSLEDLEQAQHLAHIGSWELDLTDQELMGSNEAYRILEISPDTSFEAFLEIVHPEDREAVNTTYTTALKTKTPFAVSYRLLFPEGRIKYIHGQCELIHDGDKPIRFIGTIQDITERKKAEEALRRLNSELDQRVLDRTAQLEAANKELESFTYSVSHDLRAPLRHIDGFLELLREKAEAFLDEQSRHYMDTIFNASQKMGQLVDDLLSFTRMGHHRVTAQPVNLGRLVGDILQDLEPDTAGRNIDWRIGDLPRVNGDAALLRMVLVNLISNALKFTRLRRQARIEIGSFPGQATETVIYVRDNGVGFDMAHADKLFGVFQRLHRADEFEGTGIGLATAHRIIARHGGRTWAEGKVDQGATIYFSLP